MSDVLIIEFDGVTVDDYNAVNKLLDVKVDDPGGDWPEPLTIHVAGTSSTGLTVVEVWESQAAQAEFMARLGPALAEAGLPEPKRMEWLTLVGHHIA